MTDNDTVRVTIWRDHDTGDYGFYVSANTRPPGNYTFDLDRAVLDGWTAAQQAWQAAQEDIGTLYRARTRRIEAQENVDELRARLAEAQAALDAHLAQNPEDTP